MKVNNIYQPLPALNWELIESKDNESFCYQHPHDNSYASQVPWIKVSLRDYNRIPLRETTYKEIASLIDDNFLRNKIRSRVLDGVQVLGFDHDTMEFHINSAENRHNGIQYLESIKFMEWDETLNDPELTPIEKARLLLWVGNIKLHCTCPSYLYWGYQYIMTQYDASIYPEDRPPVKRNPQLRGSVCKHLRRILQVLPFYSQDIARELGFQAGEADA